jgi:hypothetical protein
MADERQNEVPEHVDEGFRKAAKGDTPEGQNFYAPPGPAGGSNPAAAAPAADSGNAASEADSPGE